MTQSTLNFESSMGQQLKELGQAQVLEHENREWKESALSHLHTLCTKRASFTADDFRRAVLGSGQLHPHSANVWGSLVAVGIKRKWMTNSGRYVASEIMGNHGRKIPVLVSLLHIKK